MLLSLESKHWNNGVIEVVLSIVVNVTLFVVAGLLLSLMLSGFKSRLDDGGNLLKWLLFLTAIALFFSGYYFLAITPLIAAFVSINFKR